MGGFFRGWRRKTGVVTLMASLMFVGLWMRSRNVVDTITVPVGNETILGAVSFDSSVLVGMDRMPGQTFPEWVSDDSANTDGMLDDPSLEWRWQWNGFRAGAIGNTNIDVLVVSYWSIVLPLTLLSGYLLLTKPRKSRGAERAQ